MALNDSFDSFQHSAFGQFLFVSIFISQFGTIEERKTCFVSSTQAIFFLRKEILSYLWAKGFGRCKINDFFAHLETDNYGILACLNWRDPFKNMIIMPLAWTVN